jgi:hypothetical protein
LPAAPAIRGAPPVAEPAAEPKQPTPADIMARLSNLAAMPPRPGPPLRAEPQRPPPPAAERPSGEPRQRPNMFDSLWPAEVRASRQSQPEAIARAPRPEVRLEPKQEFKQEFKPEPRLDAKPEPKLDIKPEPRLEPPTPRERVERSVNVAPRGPIAPAGEPRPIAILKSGVIDGMAYTLYTDGSIEAELPQGIMRFGSIDELRSHLESAERQD